jgi:hypothetical protein
MKAETTSIRVRMLMIIVVDQATILNALLLVYSPINFLLLIRMSMKTSTNGSREPFITWERTMINSRGASGIRMMVAPMTINKVYKV